MRAHFSTDSWSTIASDFVRWAAGTLRASKQDSHQRLVTPLPPQRTPIEQWSRVTAVLAEAQARANRVLEVQKGASAQLDAATYALQRLHEEMRPAFLFTVARPAPSPVTPTAFRREQFRRREPLAA